MSLLYEIMDNKSVAIFSIISSLNWSKMEVGIIHYYPYRWYLKVFFLPMAPEFSYQRWPGPAHRQPCTYSHRRELTYSGALLNMSTLPIARWCCYYFWQCLKNRVYILWWYCPLSTGGFDVIVTFGMYSGFDIALFAEIVYEVKSRRLGRPTSDLYK